MVKVQGPVNMTYVLGLEAPSFRFDAAMRCPKPAAWCVRVLGLALSAACTRNSATELKRTTFWVRS